MIDDNVIQLNELKVLLNNEIEKCKEAIDEHKAFAEVKIIHIRISELEGIINVFLQKFLS